MCSQKLHSHVHRLTETKDSVARNDFKMNEVANASIYVTIVLNPVFFLGEIAEYCRLLH